MMNAEIKLQGIVSVVSNMLLRDNRDIRTEAAEQLKADAAEVIEEITKLKANLEASTVRLNESLYQQSRLQAENEALRGDAERYRWLRDTCEKWSWVPSRYNAELVSGFSANNTSYIGFSFEAAIEQAKGAVCKTCNGKGGWESAASSTSYFWKGCPDCTGKKGTEA